MLDAIEILGYVDKGVEICFRNVGDLVFLDPVTSPPTPLTMSVQYNDLGMTCGQVDRIGTVVLVSIATEEDTLILLSECLVTTTQTLRLRDGAGGAGVLGLGALLCHAASGFAHRELVQRKLPGYRRLD